jgi:hypothetical protein
MLVIDEDVLVDHLYNATNERNGYQYLDSKPQTLTAKAHRPSYGKLMEIISSKPAEDIYEKYML